MREQKKNQAGITLIALVISIIVMLILAGVSLNATIGENGIIKQGQLANIANKMATYKEELEMNEFQNINDEEMYRQINAFGNSIKNYIESFQESDMDVFVIVSGKLVYIGEDSIYQKVAEMQGIECNSNMLVIEERAIENIVKGDVKYGIELKDRTGTSTDWKLITEISKSTGEITKTYGSGYYYIKEGESVSQLGKIKGGYIVDYENKNTINFYSNEYTYTYIDISSTLGVKENIIFNLDAKSMQSDVNGNYNFGSGVSLRRTSINDVEQAEEEENEEIVINPLDFIENNKFTFDGDNYIEILKENSFDFSQGLTFEFYGNITGGTPGTQISRETIPLLSTYGQDFINQKRKSWAISRFMIGDDNILWYGLFPSNGVAYNNGLSRSDNVVVNQFMETKECELGENIYVTIVVSPEKYNGDDNFVIQKIFYNGVREVESYLDVKYWRAFLSKELKMFYVGKCQTETPTNWHHLIADVYAIRIYSKALSDEEVQENYGATLSYYNLNN